jgi:hypothetical protein
LGLEGRAQCRARKYNLGRTACSFQESLKGLVALPDTSFFSSRG